MITTPRPHKHPPFPPSNTADHKQNITHKNTSNQHTTPQKKTTPKTKVVERKPKQQKGSKSWKERNDDPESRIDSFDNDAIKEYFQLGVSKEDRYRIVTKPFLYDDENIEWDLTLAFSSFAAMIEHNLPPKSSKVTSRFRIANIGQVVIKYSRIHQSDHKRQCFVLMQTYQRTVFMKMVKKLMLRAQKTFKMSRNLHGFLTSKFIYPT